MSDLKRFFSFGLGVAVVELLASAWLGAAQPQNPTANWDNLKQLAPGDDIRIVLKDAKSYGARFQSVSDEAIVLRLVTGEHAFTRESVLRVSAKGQSHRLRNALIGAGIGAGLGAWLVGSCHGESYREVVPCGGTGAAIGAVALVAPGAGVGAVMPTGGWHDVYRAR